ncbi:MAG TPA: hypothetical protein VHV08_11625, partial [Pirellulales bacterium]|nr:hypothetical protein [Pirellulales bacterium]
MKTRSTINRLLRPTGYEIVKTHGSHSVWELAPGQILDMDAIAERVKPGRKHVWISAAPKSGSTWFSLMVGWLLDWPTVRLTSGYDRKEHEVDLLPLLAYPDVNIFSPRQHCRASQPTLDFIAKFQVHPVIQLRDVFDSVVSLRDHLVGEDRRMSMAYVDDRFLEFGEERQFEFIVD